MSYVIPYTPAEIAGMRVKRFGGGGEGGDDGEGDSDDDDDDDEGDGEGDGDDGDDPDDDGKEESKSEGETGEKSTGEERVGESGDKANRTPKAQPKPLTDLKNLPTSGSGSSSASASPVKHKRSKTPNVVPILLVILARAACWFHQQDQSRVSGSGYFDKYVAKQPGRERKESTAGGHSGPPDQERDKNLRIETNAGANVISTSDLTTSSSTESAPFSNISSSTISTSSPLNSGGSSGVPSLLGSPSVMTANYRRRDRERSGTLTREERQLQMLDSTVPKNLGGGAPGLEAYMAERVRAERERIAVGFGYSHGSGLGPDSVSSDERLTLGLAGSDETPEDERFPGGGGFSPGFGAGDGGQGGGGGGRGFLQIPPVESLNWKPLIYGEGNRNGYPTRLSIDPSTWNYLSDVLFPLHRSQSPSHIGKSSLGGNITTQTNSTISPIHALVVTLLRDIYGYWPGNLVQFARDPTKYLDAHKIQCCYDTKGWKQLWDSNDEVTKRINHLMKDFAFNPIMLQFSPEEELDNISRFQKTDIAELVAMSHRLWSTRNSESRPSLLQRNSLNAGSRADPKPSSSIEMASISPISPGDISPAESVSPPASRRIQTPTAAIMIGGGKAAQVGYTSQPINTMARPLAGGNGIDKLKRDNAVLLAEVTHFKRLADIYLGRESFLFPGNLFFFFLYLN